MPITAQTATVRVHIEKTLSETHAEYVAHVDFLDANGNVLRSKVIDWIDNAHRGYKQAVDWANGVLAEDGLVASWDDEYDEFNQDDPQEFPVSRS